MIDGRLVLGVVAMPAVNRCICGIPGEGLWELVDNQPLEVAEPSCAQYPMV